MVCLLLASVFGFAGPFPIHFAIPESKIVETIPDKTEDFASLIPGDLRTYIYQTETDYCVAYQESYYALTTKKGGWDCLRHYEILANGCIPYFLDLDQCPENTMTLFPKELILEAMHLPGVSYRHIDHTQFDPARYNDLLRQLINYTREHLTTKKIAQHVLDTLGYKGTGKILFLTHDPSPDYLRCLTLIGFKELLGDLVIDVPKIEHIYADYPYDQTALYGRGFTYTKIVPDLPVDRSDIEKRIQAQEFDLIIYGSVCRGLRYHELVQQVYDPSQIVYLCGEDTDICDHSLPNIFIRELQ